ncbi:MAG: chromosomal replication initiator protein DnaA [Rikenellaceae bacterium]
MSFKSEPYINNWSNCLAHIKQRTSKEDFSKWFASVSIYSFDGETLRLTVPDAEYANYIDKNFIAFLKPIIMQEFGTSTKLKYVIGTSNSANAITNTHNNVMGNLSNIKNPFENVVRKMNIDSQLNFDYSFENFVEGDCNRFASVTGKAVAKEPGRSIFNPVFIYGSSGLGKTHLAQAIGIEVKKNFPDKNVLYVSAYVFLDQFMNACRRKEVSEFVNFYQSLDLLILDDIQALSGKQQTQDVFFNIFQHLHLSNKQLVFTCDKSPDDLKDIEQRLITRFKWAVSSELTLPSCETRKQIIKNKAEKLHLNMSDEVIAFFAHNMNVSIREIEGAISSYAAHTTLLGEVQSLDLARLVIKSYSKMEKKELTIETIQQVVCEAFSVSKKDFFSTKRTKEVALARQVAMCITKENTTMSLKAIGQALGGKSHATVLHAIKTVSNLIETDADLKKVLSEINSKLL